MILHISFSDGSNPWVFYGDETECEHAVEQWDRDYILIQQENVFEDIKSFYAYNKAE